MGLITHWAAIVGPAIELGRARIRRFVLGRLAVYGVDQFLPAPIHSVVEIKEDPVERHGIESKL
jgi:hypothetical protein